MADTKNQHERLEADLQQRIRLVLNHYGTFWRNNVGSGHLVQTASLRCPCCNAPVPVRGRWVDFGLCAGSSDLIGITYDGRFAAVEVKTSTGRTSDAQKNFIAHIKKHGGIAVIARNTHDIHNTFGEILR